MVSKLGGPLALIIFESAYTGRYGYIELVEDFVGLETTP